MLTHKPWRTQERDDEGRFKKRPPGTAPPKPKSATKAPPVPELPPVPLLSGPEDNRLVLGLSAKQRDTFMRVRALDL